MRNSLAQYLATERSGNAKTGPIMVVTSEKRTCPPSCPFIDAGCYAQYGPLGHLWRALSGADPDQDSIKNGRAQVKLHTLKQVCRMIGRQFRKIWRLNQAGDLPGDGEEIDEEALDMIVVANAKAEAMGFTYTHKTNSIRNLRIIRETNARGFTINLSANNLEHADQLYATKSGPVAVVLPIEQMTNTKTRGGHKVVICPAITRDDVTCEKCKLCARQRDFIIGFPAHGIGKKKVVAAAAA